MLIYSCKLASEPRITRIRNQEMGREQIQFLRGIIIEVASVTLGRDPPVDCLEQGQSDEERGDRGSKRQQEQEQKDPSVTNDMRRTCLLHHFLFLVLFFSVKSLSSTCSSVFLLLLRLCVYFCVLCVFPRRTTRDDGAFFLLNLSVSSDRADLKLSVSISDRPGIE